MRPKFSVEDISISDIISTEYSLGIFFSGYEQRCSHLASLIDAGKIERCLVLSVRGEPSCYEENSEVQAALQGSEIRCVSISSFKSLEFAIDLHQELMSLDEGAKVLIDYSSMPRQCYVDVLNIMGQPLVKEKKIAADFFYAHGRHDSFSSAKYVGDIYCLRGCEASISSCDRTIAIVGLGFDDSAPLRILESIEPNDVYCIYAYPSAVDGYDKEALDKNQSLLHMFSPDPKKQVPAPISSVASAFGVFFEVVTPFLSSCNVTLLPFGPKPHVLASTLLAMSSHRISSMYADTLREGCLSVPATGDVTCTRVKLQG